MGKNSKFVSMHTKSIDNTSWLFHNLLWDWVVQSRLKQWSNMYACVREFCAQLRIVCLFADIQAISFFCSVFKIYIWNFSYPSFYGSV